MNIDIPSNISLSLRNIIARYIIDDNFRDIIDIYYYDLDMIEWCYRVMKPSKLDIIQLDFPRWFCNICEKEDVNILEWIYKTFNLSREDCEIVVGYLYRLICPSASLNIVKWIVNSFKMTKKECSIHEDYVFREACLLGNLEVAQWIAEITNLTADNITICHTNSFKITYYRSTTTFSIRKNVQHLEVAKWLVKKFKLDKDDFAISEIEFKKLLE
jgi:hypothetical protein